MLKKIRLEFPSLDIFFPKRSSFFNIPPRNLFIFQREKNSKLGNYISTSIHFITDNKLTKDDLINIQSNTSINIIQGKMIFNQIYITWDILPEVLNKLHEICPHITFERIFLNKCTSNKPDVNKEVWGATLINLIYKISIHTYSVLRDGKSNLIIEKIELNAYGIELLLLIRNLMTNRLFDNANNQLNIKLSEDKFCLLMMESDYYETYGLELIDFINYCCIKVIRDIKKYKEEISINFDLR